MTKDDRPVRHVIATAGHVDHGKSTLVRALTGMEPDRFEEEQRRGLTIDLGFVWTELQDDRGNVHTLAFVDVPGHHRFVSNMLAGAGAIHDAMLVVAADDGWSPQSEEHLTILDLLGARGVAAVVTKADTVDADRVEAVVAQVVARLERTSLEGTPVVATDSLSGRGLDELRRLLVQPSNQTVSDADVAPDVRLWIDRSFSIAGAGAVVTGTVQGGQLEIGAMIQHSPSGRSLRIRGLQSLGRPVDSVSGGERAAVNLAGISHDEMERGDALLTGPWIETTTADVVVRSLSERPISDRGAWHAHAGAAEIPVQIRPLLGPIDPGETAPARLEFSWPVPLRFGDRLVLRDIGEQVTTAGARVLDPSPGSRPKGMLGRLESAELLESLAAARSPSQRVALLLEAHGGWEPAERLRAAMGPTTPEQPDGTTKVDDHLVLDVHVAGWRQAAVAAASQVDPTRGIALEDVVAATRTAGAPPGIARPIVDQLVQSGDLALHGTIVTTGEAAPTYLQARQERWDQVLAAMSAEPLQPPDIQVVTDRASLRNAELKGLFDSGLLVKVRDVVLTGAAIALAVDRLRHAFGDQPFSAADARDAWETTRKFAVPLLEHLAATSRTTFDGETHRLK